MGYIGVTALYPNGSRRRGFIGPFDSIDEQNNFMDYLEGRYERSETKIVLSSLEKVPEGLVAVNPIDFENIGQFPAVI